VGVIQHLNRYHLSTMFDSAKSMLVEVCPDCSFQSVWIHRRTVFPKLQIFRLRHDPPSARPTARPSDRPFVHLSVRPSVRPSDCPSVHSILRPTVRLSIRPSDRPTIRPIVHPTVCPIVHPTVRLCVRPTVGLDPGPMVPMWTSKNKQDTLPTLKLISIT
jgi:hypothetical protein